MPSSAEISVVIVNYGTADLAIKAVQSVLNLDHNGRVVDVHLVDNASPGDDGQQLRDAFTASNDQAPVTLYLETENHGFGRGNNLVFNALKQRTTPPDYIFLLNPDAELSNDTLSILAHVLDTQPKVAAVGAGISLPSGTPVTAAFRFPSAAAEFSQALNFGPVSRLMPKAHVALPPDQAKGPVDWVAGAAVMLRHDVLCALEGFDPAFFLYYEEVDLMRRIKAAGHEIWYVPQARVVHAEGAATQVRSGDTGRRAKPEYWYDSWQIYYRKNHGRTGAFWAAATWMTGAAINCVIAPLRRQPPRMPLHFFRDITRFVLIPLTQGNRRRS